MLHAILVVFAAVIVQSLRLRGIIGHSSYAAIPLIIDAALQARIIQARGDYNVQKTCAPTVTWRLPTIQDWGDTRAFTGDKSV